MHFPNKFSPSLLAQYEKTVNVPLLTSLSKLVPAAVVGLSSGLYGLKRVLKFSGTEREDLKAGAGLGWPHP